MCDLCQWFCEVLYSIAICAADFTVDQKVLNYCCSACSHGRIQNRLNGDLKALVPLIHLWLMALYKCIYLLTYWNNYGNSLFVCCKCCHSLVCFITKLHDIFHAVDNSYFSSVTIQNIFVNFVAQLFWCFQSHFQCEIISVPSSNLFACIQNMQTFNSSELQCLREHKLKQFTDIVYRVWLQKRLKFANFAQFTSWFLYVLRRWLTDIWG